MREGPKLGVDAYGVRRCGSVMLVCKQPIATLTLQTFAKVFLGRRFYIYYKSFFASIKLFYKHLDHFVVH